MMIDEVDVKIIKKLGGWEWKGTITELAEAAEVSEDAVQRRMRKLEEAGIILYYGISLTPWVFGGEWIWAEAGITLQNPLFKDNVIKELKSGLDYFEEATTFTVIPSGSRPDIFVTFHARNNERYRQEVRKISDIEGVARADTCILEHMDVSRTELDGIDWKVLSHLKRNTNKTSRDVTEETGDRQDDVERRINRLVDGKKLFFFAAIDRTKIDNWAHIHVKVTFRKKLSQTDIAELDAAGIAPPHDDWTRVKEGVFKFEPRCLRELIEKVNKICIAGMKIQSLSIEDCNLSSQPWLDKVTNSRQFLECP